MRRQSALIPLAFIAACATAPPSPQPPETPAQAQERRAKAPRPVYNLTGYPPALREGYIDGCESAKASPYAHKDEKRYFADAQYQMGWKDGFSLCSRK
jgi:hypothetical protein